MPRRFSQIDALYRRSFADAEENPPLLDTLKLAKRMREAGTASGQAEALAEGLVEGLNEATASKADLTAAVDRLEARMGTLDVRMDALYWRIMAGVAGLLVVHFIGLWLFVLARLP